jgi:DNA-binding MarR family transcriptional regulator
MYMKMVVNKDDEVFDALVRTWSVWWFKVPDRLARQESSLVVRLLTLGSREGGILQSELKQELGIAQPRLSKLMEKLKKKKVGWIQVGRSEKDRRVWLMTTTAAAQDSVAALKKDLAILLRTQLTMSPIRWG